MTDIDDQDAEAQRTSMFHAACERGDIDAVRALLDGRGDIDRSDARGRTALMIAASRNHIDMMILLLERGADPGSRNASGTTPLMFAKTAAFAYGDCTGMKLLLEAGADAGARDKKGLTALDYTIQRAALVRDFLETHRK